MGNIANQKLTTGGAETRRDHYVFRKSDSPLYQSVWSARVKWALAGLGFGTTKSRVFPMRSGCAPKTGGRPGDFKAMLQKGRYAVRP
jgi:hypothetical protein